MFNPYQTDYSQLWDSLGPKLPPQQQNRNSIPYAPNMVPPNQNGQAQNAMGGMNPSQMMGMLNMFKGNGANSDPSSGLLTGQGGTFGGNMGSNIQWNPTSYGSGTMLGDDYGLMGGSSGGGSMLGDDYGLLGSSGGGSSAGGGMSGLAGAATPLAFAAMIGGGKLIEHNNPDSTYGRGLLSMLGPDFNQIKADPKLGFTTALGVPFLNGFIRNDKAAHAKPEWDFFG